MKRRSAAGTVADVYLTVVGQDDNLGDSILRRGLVRACSVDGARLHVAAGRHGAGYLGNLGLPAGTITYTSNVRWVVSALRRSVGGRVGIAFGSGELAGLRGLVKLTVITALSVAARCGGGIGLLTGVGVRSVRDRRLGRILRVSAGCTSLTAWRDRETARLAGRGRFVPDWAFGEGRTTDLEGTAEPREVMAVSVRGDRPAWSAAAVSAVRRVADARGLRVVVYAQVRQDDDACGLLADRLAADRLVWEGTDHAGHERAVRELCRRSELVVGDRLHGLVVGMTEGATPCALGMDTIEKVDRTLRSVGLPGLAHCLRGRSEGDISDLLERALARRAETAAAVDRARAQVAELRGEVRAVLAGGGPRGVPAPPPIKVLLALAPPDGTTRYVDQVCSELPGDIRAGFFSWPRALLGRYDVLHLHWPEHFLRGRPSVLRAGSYLAFGALYLRTVRSRVAVVRTLHNVDPHDAVDGARARALLERWDARVDHYIRINTVTPIPPHRPTATILHGHYRDRFACHRVHVADENRLLYFGLLRPYKGVERLLEVFSGAGTPSSRLRIVGRPVDVGLADAVRRAEAVDPRISALLDFVSDERAVREITSACLVVLPYREMHNSGVVLVALSLGRPVLVPRSPATEALDREAGPGWVTLFEAPLTWDDIERAQEHSRSRLAPPTLGRRDWGTVGRGHAAVYREAARNRRERFPRPEESAPALPDRSAPAGALRRSG